MRINKIIALTLILIVVCSEIVTRKSTAQSGVLIASTRDKPDDKVLSLAQMSVDICVDNQFATIKVVQIFDNHTAETLEGKYLFALPLRGQVSDFAVWDNDSRIPGVIMETRRAAAVYAEIKQATIDPGLLEQTDEHGGTSAFSAKIFPINSYGTKRLEMEYTEMLAVENLDGKLQSRLTFPLKSSDGAPLQRVGEFHLHLCVNSDYPIAPVVSEAFPLKINKQNQNEFDADFRAENFELKDDFAFGYEINHQSNALSLIAHRAPEQISAYDLRDPARAAQNPDGYFEARTIFQSVRAAENSPRRVILLLDTSLSMAGEKLTKAVAAADFFLHNLNPTDEFNLILFNDETKASFAAPVAATTDNVENALNFVRNSNLGGGTNLKLALEKAVAASANFSGDAERSIVLISDANPTRQTVDFKKIAAVFENKQNQLPPRLYAFALGSDANVSLLKDLTAKTGGALTQARETEDITVALKIFFARIGQPIVQNLKFKTPNETNLYQIYSLGADGFANSDLAFIGRYKQPGAQTISIVGNYGAEPIEITREADFPALETDHEHLPRLWARARVDALLQEINRNGEREDYISEIISLSQKYKFVTPYTAFLAAPRALLRPRLIQPGDPVIRVKTDPSVTAVFAVLPFGETLPLKFLQSEKVWETRFLAPAWMPDGTYACRLLLTDKNGNGYEERKTFVVDSHAPKLKINLAAQTVRAGDEILVKVAADGDTARLTAKLYGARPADLRWSDADKANVGKLTVPANLSAGKYLLSVTAEDFAHNQSTAEINVEVLGR